MILRELRPAIVMLVVMTIITGVIYPLAMTAISQVVFPQQANGSLIVQDGEAVGSRLVGQHFDDPRYFWGRLSATGTVPYNAFNAANLTASSGSNYGPTTQALLDGVQARVDALRAADAQAGLNTSDPIPVDLVTASGSGLDPHISPAAATFQAQRVATLRGLPLDQVYALIDQNTQGRTLGLLGEPVVNVLELNLDLDALPG